MNKEWILIHAAGTYYGKNGEWTIKAEDAMILEAAQAANLLRRFRGVAMLQRVPVSYAPENLTTSPSFSSSLVAA